METHPPIETRAVTVPEQSLPQAPATPDQLLALAVDKNLDIDKLEKLMELQERYNRDLARKAFFEAIGTFQSSVPELRKTKHVSFEMKNGGTTEYHYAPLADIVRQIKDVCRKCGLSYRWEIHDTKEEIKVSCLVTHTDGHTEVTTMTATPDLTGSKNPIQARGSAIEYLKRYTLIGALGLTTTDSDIDGRLPELDIDKLHQQYMEIYNKITEKDPGFLSVGDPDNWKAKTPEIYVKAIGKARQVLAKLTVKND